MAFINHAVSPVSEHTTNFRFRCILVGPLLLCLCRSLCFFAAIVVSCMHGVSSRVSSALLCALQFPLLERNST